MCGCVFDAGDRLETKCSAHGLHHHRSGVPSSWRRKGKEHNWGAVVLVMQWEGLRCVYTNMYVFPVSL